MQGALSLGKEVADNLSLYLKKNMIVGFDGRRSGSHSPASTIAIIVDSAFLCRHLSFCKDSYEAFFNEYIITQTQSIEAIFKNLIQKDREDSNTVIFELELKKILKDIRRMLEIVNDRINEDNEISIWMELLKKISILFKDRAMTFGIERLEGNVDAMNEVKKKLQQTLVVATTTIELKFERKLCADYHICQMKHNVSKSLYNLLDTLSVLSEDKIKLFIKIFSEALKQTSFFDIISEITADEFRSILNDIAYSNTIHAENVFSALKETVKSRIESMKTNKNTATGRDVKLVHIILSDLDYLYSKHKTDSFNNFLTEFREWVKSGGTLNTEVSKIMKEMMKTMAKESEELVNKLVTEVKVFLEITVDPE